MKTHRKVGLFALTAVLAACSGCDKDQENWAADGSASSNPSAHPTQFRDATNDSNKTRNFKHVETGLDVLVRTDFDILRGQRVGIITNHTGLAKDGRHVVDILHRARHVNLRAIFGPEHGVRGVEADGKAVKSNIDPETGLPVYSLYGETKRPTEDMIEELDVLVFDIQDVGARFYTYIYTMALAMETAALHDKRFVVLDRPNPITGAKVEGPMLQAGFESFVGLYELPVRHGMTVGELARLFMGERWIEKAESLDLQVVEMIGWSRDLWHDQTDVPWVGPSPSMRTLAAATVYPGTCFLEGTTVTEGRGTEKPFELIGAPWINSTRLADALNSIGLPGVIFEPVQFKPVAILPSVPRPKHKDEECGGVFLSITNRDAFLAVETGTSIVYTIKRLYPRQFSWTRAIDRLYGSDYLRKSVDDDLALGEILSTQKNGLDEFEELRAKYRLYE